MSGLAVLPASTPVSSTLTLLAAWMPMPASLATTAAVVVVELAAGTSNTPCETHRSGHQVGLLACPLMNTAPTPLAMAINLTARLPAGAIHSLKVVLSK